MIIFIWKISQGLVQGYSVDFTDVHGHRGRTALPHDVNHSSCSSVKRARESSLGVKGAKISVVDATLVGITLPGPG